MCFLSRPCAHTGTQRATNSSSHFLIYYLVLLDYRCQPLPPAPDVVHSFLTLNFNARLASCLSTLSKLRHTLLYPGLTVQQSALIHLALQLRGDAVRLQAFEGECQLGREIAKEADDADGSEEVSMRHAACDATHAEVSKDWQTVE